MPPCGYMMKFGVNKLENTSITFDNVSATLVVLLQAYLSFGCPGPASKGVPKTGCFNRSTLIFVSGPFTSTEKTQTDHLIVALNCPSYGGTTSTPLNTCEHVASSWWTTILLTKNVCAFSGKETFSRQPMRSTVYQLCCRCSEV